MTNLPIKRIVIHCTATKEGVNYTRDDIRAWHKARGWKDIGYHWVIDLHGSMAVGRPEGVIGASVEGWNTGTVAVVYVGGLDDKGKPKDTRTPEQHLALAKIVKELHQRYPDAKIMGHRDLSPDLDHDGVVEPNEWLKECPCFDVKKEVAGWLK